MNLGKLLGAGKSFFGGGGKVAYREKKGVYLPKFNVEKNPFLPKPAEPAPVAAEPAMKKIYTPVTAPVAAQTQKIPALSAPKPVRTAGWATKLNPFRAPEPAAPPLAGAVQVELSLDAVKVVHNDLADADIEVVPVKSRSVASPEAPVLPPSREAWEFMGERLVKSL